jgi:hypothetical protein
MRSTKTEACFFSNTTRDKLHMRFVFASSLTSHQIGIIFAKLKAEISSILISHQLETQFEFRLLMSCAEPSIFLNVMLGWLGACEENKPVKDQCERVFHLLFPDVHEMVSDQHRVYHRRLLRDKNQTEKEYLFNEMKEDITIEIKKHHLQNDFFTKLMMLSPDAEIFLCVLVGWLGALPETNRLYAKCISIFCASYPDIFKLVDDQSPIRMPT